MSEPAKPVGFTFTETMRGHIAPGEHDDYAQAEKLGKRLGDKLRFTVTIGIDDLNAFLAAPEHPARLTGTVEAQRFGGTVPLEDGRFNLFIEEGGRKQMRYTMTFRDRHGERLRLDGYKDVHNDPGIDIWTDTTTLFARVYRLDGRGEAGTTAVVSEPVVATGILRIRALDLVPQVRSMRAVGAHNAAESASALLAFGRFFFDRLWDEYHTSLKPSLPRRRRAGAVESATPRE
jgi:cholesterol oxidase